LADSLAEEMLENSEGIGATAASLPYLSGFQA
jgi:hypothetical protein